VVPNDREADASNRWWQSLNDPAKGEHDYRKNEENNCDDFAAQGALLVM